MRQFKYDKPAHQLNEVATMEEPVFQDFVKGWNEITIHKNYDNAWAEYKRHLSSLLKSIPVSGQVDWEDGKVIPENEINIEDCGVCGGDGKETCSNPDHGFISAMPGDTGRLGCPVCGHDPNHKVKNGGQCDECNGTGLTAIPLSTNPKIFSAIVQTIQKEIPYLSIDRAKEIATRIYNVMDLDGTFNHSKPQ
jgi:hypothetical protein